MTQGRATASSTASSLATPRAGGSCDASRPRASINATGPFSRRASAGSPTPPRQPLIAPSQGIHLVLDALVPAGRHRDHGAAHRRRPRAVRDPVARPHARRHDRHADPDADARAAPAAGGDRLHPRNAGQLPAKAPTRADILSVFAGIRPLVQAATARTPPRSRAITRSTSTHSGLLTITGGKWTTYRNMAEDAVDQAADLARLTERAVRHARRCTSTASTTDAERFGALARLRRRTRSRSRI